MGIVKDILYKISKKEFLFAFKKQTIFPYYHLVSDNQIAHIENLYQFKNRKQFTDDLDFLLANYNPINLLDILDRKKVKNSFLLTFDDGLHEVYSVIYPILKQKKLKAVFFINPNFVDNNEGLYKHYISIIINHLKATNYEKESIEKISQLFSFSYESIDEFKKKFINIKFAEREKVTQVLEFLAIDIQQYLSDYKPYISKKQIQEMLDDGFYFGGHTMSHPPLNQLSHKEQKEEIINSINWLKENFNINYSLFAFPFSDKGVSKKLLNELFEYDNTIRIFGNAGIKKDFDERIIQRFSLEHPNKQTDKQIITENLYKYYNKVIGKYNITRK